MEDNCFPMLCWFLPYKMWISHKYTYVPSLLSLPPTLPRISAPSHHWRLHRALGWAPFATQQIPVRHLFYIWWGMYVNATFSVPVPPFKMLVYFPVLKVIWTHPPALITMWCLFFELFLLLIFSCAIFFCFAENYHDYVWFSSLNIFLCYLKEFIFSWLLFDGYIIFHQKTMVCLCELANKKMNFR